MSETRERQWLADEIPTEALQAAARAYDDSLDEQGYLASLGSFRQIHLNAMRAAAPYLIAEGRRQAAAEIRAKTEAVLGQALERACPLPLATIDEHPFALGAEWAARIAEGTAHPTPAGGS